MQNLREKLLWFSEKSSLSSCIENSDSVKTAKFSPFKMSLIMASWS